MRNLNNGERPQTVVLSFCKHQVRSSSLLVGSRKPPMRNVALLTTRSHTGALSECLALRLFGSLLDPNSSVHSFKRGGTAEDLWVLQHHFYGPTI
jgi:hypothetical protein